MRWLSSWWRPLQAALAGLLAALLAGTLLLVAVKLQFPSIGSGADSTDVFTSIVVLGLACLRAPVHIGGVTVGALPLTLTVAIAWSLAVAARRLGLAGAGELARVAVAFGSLCALAALVFRFRGSEPVYAGAIGSFFWGAIWGGAGLWVGRVLAWVARPGRFLEALRRRDLAAGVLAGAAIVGVALILAFAGGLIFAIVALARGALPQGFGAGDAAAAVTYVLAFAPNLALCVLSLGLGAPVQVGARLGIGGSVSDEVASYSIWGWGGSGAPGGLWLLVLVPLLVCVGAGYALRALSAERPPRIAWAGCAATVGLTVLVGAWLGEARLGAGLAGANSFMRVTIHPLAAGALAALWTGAGVAGGWLLADRRSAGAKEAT